MRTHTVLAPSCETRPDVKSFDLGLLQSFPSSSIWTEYIEPFDLDLGTIVHT